MWIVFNNEPLGVVLKTFQAFRLPPYRLHPLYLFVKHTLLLFNLGGVEVAALQGCYQPSFVFTQQTRLLWNL